MSEYAKNIQTVEDLWKKRIGLRKCGGRMSEYIITCDDEVAGWVGNDVESMRPLVRCRDCEHYMDYEHEYEPNLGYCRFHDMEEVRDSQFCAWAERREP